MHINMHNTDASVNRLDQPEKGEMGTGNFLSYRPAKTMAHHRVRNSFPE